MNYRIKIIMGNTNFHKAVLASKLLFISALLLCGSHLVNVMGQQLAFPTAEGFGAYSSGGRGGDVYHVTNLNDGGPGSLRYGIESAGGPRTIVFDTSGTIRLLSRLSVSKPYITIAGQTAPGDGICLRDYEFRISADHVIVRFIRARLGDVSAQESDAISIVSGKNIILDHCSAAWSVDEVLSCSTGDKDKIDKVTVQWCVIAEGLNESVHTKGEHSYGALIRGCYGAQYSYLHNLFAHNRSRNPRPGNYDDNPHDQDPEGLQFDFRNNVMYNWAGNRPGYDADKLSVCRYNYVGNYGKPGPNSSSQGYAYDVGSPYFRAYYSGNYFYGGIPADQWSLVDFGGFTSSQIADYKQPGPFTTGPVQTLSAQDAYRTVMAHVGASLSRDTLDARVINDVQKGTGSIIDSQAEVGGWPVLKALPAPIDTDRDGMPDEWETARSLNPNDPADRNGDDNSNGYTNLEEYLNELVGELPVWHYLEVQSGSGTGAYPEGTLVNISAKTAPRDHVFDRWTGDTIHLSDVYDPNTTVLMPAEGVDVTAVYSSTVSVDPEELNEIIRCYPNPAGTGFSIDLGTLGSSSIKIFNLAGKLVYQALATGSVHQVKDMKLSSGIYAVRITDSGNTTYTRKIMIK